MLVHFLIFKIFQNRLFDFYFHFRHFANFSKFFGCKKTVQNRSGQNLRKSGVQKIWARKNVSSQYSALIGCQSAYAKFSSNGAVWEFTLRNRAKSAPEMKSTKIWRFFSQRKFVWEKNLKMDDLDSNSQIMDSQFTRDENEIVKEICELFEVSIYILHSLL